jgi:UDP-N-acetylenolpyruvoylglucosamine reductase
MTSYDLCPCAAVRRADLGARTTLRVGGSAELLLEPATPDELRDAVRWVRDRGEPLRILGGGANLIVADGHIAGTVIATERLRRAYRYVPPAFRGDAWLEQEGPDDRFTELAPRLALPEEESEPRLVAWAGASMPSLVNTAKRLGWSGLEGLAGVPGSIGGGVAMNAGGSWGDLWDVVEQVRVVDGDGEFRDLERAECAPSYRNGNLGSAVVAGVVLKLRPSTKRAVEEQVRSHLVHKRAVQPVTEWSAGCVFKNPDPELSAGRSAGRLIDECGLKGRRVGGAEVSPLHGNFVINRGGATASEVLQLIGQLESEVFERTGVALQREVKVWTG